MKVKKANVDFDIASPLLFGKTVVCFGDSIFGMTRDSTSVPAWAAAFTGAQVYNVGFGGCRMAVHPTSGYAAFSMWALAEAIADGKYTAQDAQASSGADYFPQQLAILKSIDFAAVDMAVIHYGTNDFTGNVVIDDATNGDNTATLCGALRYAIGKLQTAYPKLRIFVSLPIYRKWDSVGAESYTNGNGKTLREFGTAMASVADEFNCPCIDGYKTLGINAANAAAFLADGTHLNDYGRQVFGEYIGGCLAAPSFPQGEKGEDAAADLALGLTGATVGQIAKITAVDTDGKPTAWEPVDMPSGGSEMWEKLVNATLEEAVETVTYSFKRCKRIKALITPVLTANVEGWKRITINNVSYLTLNSKLLSPEGLCIEVDSEYPPYVTANIGIIYKPDISGINSGQRAVSLKNIAYNGITQFGCQTAAILTAGTKIEIWGVKS